MMTRSWPWVAALLLSCTVASAQSLVLQEGTSGGVFAETHSCVIHDTGGDGTTSKGTTLVLGDGRGLIAFPRLVGGAAGQLPPGALVTSATLELYVLNVTGAASTRNLDAHPVFDLSGAGPWTEPAAPVTQASGVGASWLSRDARPGISTPWTTPGGDVLRLGLPYSPNANIAQGGGFWVTLDVTLVVFAQAQGWSNQGWSLEVDQSGDDLVIASEDHADPALRPRLNVAWSGAAAPMNHLPPLDDRSETTSQGISKFIPLPLVDVDGQSIHYVVRELPQHGTLQGQGWYTYVPAPGYVGSDSFTLFAHDGFASTREVRVTIDVQASSLSDVSVFSDANGNSVRATTVAIDANPANQESVEGQELIASGSYASLIDFPGLVGAANGLPTGAVILSAQLELSVTQAQGSQLSRSFELAPLLNPSGASPWVEAAAPGTSIAAGASWLYRDARSASLVPWLVPGGAIDAGRASSTSGSALQNGDTLSFDVTAALQAWTLGTSLSGWRLRALDADATHFASDEHATPSRRPRLTVVWRGVSTTPTPLPPVASAGADRVVVANERVVLDGSGSYDPNGETLSYFWAQIAGPAVTLGNPASPTLEFDAPNVASETTLEFTLVVDDGNSTGLDNVIVRVAAAPAVPDAPPVAHAGNDQNVFEASFVILDGDASFDPEGAQLSFSWEQISGPAVNLTVIPGGGRSVFQAPPSPTGGTFGLFFRLSVSDGVHTSHDWVKIEVHPSPNIPPQVEVSPTQSARSDSWVGVDATGSTDPDPYTQLSYSWTQLSGPAVTLHRADGEVAYFRTPIVQTPTALVFQVAVSDGVDIVTATTTVNVDPAPVQFSGSPQSLQPHTAPLTRDEARHLLRRAGFGGSNSDVDTLLAQGLDATVNQMLAPTQNALLDVAAWSRVPAPLGQDTYPRASSAEVAEWWLTYMLEAQMHNQLREKIAYFWHDLFAASGRVADEAREEHWRMKQLDFFRQNPFPNYRSFLIDITRDDLMLDWLDGHDNVVGAANENYARELWELFTLGEHHPFTGAPNYSEADIREASRALTGWERYDPGNIAGDSYYSRFNAQRFDPGLKTFFGYTGPWTDVDVIDITLTRPEAAEFICWKLFRYFVHENPSYATIQSLAQTLSTNWEIAPIVAILLKSEAMFSPEAHRDRIKTPLELLVGFSRETGLRLPVSEIRERLSQLGHEMGNPPNVKGWEEGIFLLGAASSSLRAQAINAFAHSGFLGVNVNLDGFLPSADLRNGPNTVQRVLDVLDLEMQNENQMHLAIQYMDSIGSSGGTVPSFFNGDDPQQADRKLRGLFFVLAVGNPEYQLN